MTEEQDDRPSGWEYPGVVARYYRDHPFRAIAHIFLGMATGGMWLVGWFVAGFILFWSGNDNRIEQVAEYRK